MNTPTLAKLTSITVLPMDMWACIYCLVKGLVGPSSR
jgi:hypothetical protein